MGVSRILLAGIACSSSPRLCDACGPGTELPCPPTPLQMKPPCCTSRTSIPRWQPPQVHCACCNACKQVLSHTAQTRTYVPANAWFLTLDSQQRLDQGGSPAPRGSEVWHLLRGVWGLPRCLAWLSEARLLFAVRACARRMSDVHLKRLTVAFAMHNYTLGSGFTVYGSVPLACICYAPTSGLRAQGYEAWSTYHRGRRLPLGHALFS